VIVILKALADISDLQIYNKVNTNCEIFSKKQGLKFLFLYKQLVKGQSSKSAISDRVEVLIRGSKAMSLNTREECLTHLGKNFRVVLNITNPEVTDR